MSHQPSWVNKLRVEWHDDRQKWQVISPNGQILAEFDEKPDAILYAGRQRNHSRTAARAAHAPFESREEDTTWSIMYGLFLLAGLPVWAGILIVIVVLSGVFWFGIPLIVRVFGIAPSSDAGPITISEIASLFALGFLALVAVGTLMAVIMSKLVGLREGLRRFVLSPLYLTTWFAIRIGIGLGVLAAVMGILNLFGFTFWGTILFSVLWLLANYGMNRILWNMSITSIETG